MRLRALPAPVLDRPHAPPTHLAPPPALDEERRLGSRLACQVQVTKAMDGMVIAIPDTPPNVSWPPTCAYRPDQVPHADAICLRRTRVEEGCPAAGDAH